MVTTRAAEPRVVTAFLLLVIAVAAYLLPEPIAEHLGHFTGAWETVLKGVQTTALWLFAVAVATRWTTSRRLTTSMAGAVMVTGGWYGAFHSVQQALCRAAHPMTRPVNLPKGQFLCDAAGYETAHLTLIATCLVVIVVCTVLIGQAKGRW